MKKRYIVLISILGVLLIFIGFALGCVINGTCPNKYSNSNEYLSNWMSLIKDDAKLNDIIIPGSHDSGSYDMPYVAETQTNDIEEQLNLGVRYFDIRINYKDNECVIFHDIVNGVKAEPIFKIFKEFLEKNTSEVLILDFLDFENESEKKVIEFINAYLNTLVLHNNTTLSDLAFIDSLKLKDVRGKCIILFKENSYTSLDYIFKRNNDSCTKNNASINSMYKEELNSLTSVSFINQAIPKYIENIKEKINTESYKGLFVLQCQLTDLKKIFGPWSKEKNHEENIASFISSMNTYEDFKYVNIILRDFITQEKAENIIKMNYYKELSENVIIIKDEYEDIFMNTFKVA